MAYILLTPILYRLTKIAGLKKIIIHNPLKPNGKIKIKNKLKININININKNKNVVK